MKFLITLLLIIISAIVGQNAYSQSKSSRTLTPTVTLKSTNFKQLVGNNRVEAFRQIQMEIVTTDIANANNGEAAKMGLKPTSKTDLKILMGEPTLITGGGFWEYNLKSSPSTCKVVFGFDKNSEVIFYTLKNCQ